VIELPQMLQKAGYRVPDDFGLAGTSVLGHGEKSILAGLDQNSEEIGRVAVLVVLSLISDNARGLPPIPRQILVKGRWVDGASLPDRSVR
jgi:DNA-binding LacI/PurR family transcriptional regulator